MIPKIISRRQFLGAGLAFGTGIVLGLTGLAQESTAEATEDADMHLALTGKLKQVHDPVMIKDGANYYIFHTGNGIAVRKSADMLEWQNAFPPNVFPRVPDWALEKIPGATNIWAPDISYFNGKFHLYYSVSTFGSNRSMIGLATNTMLDSEAEGFEWLDEGLVIESTGVENYNCIDANLIIDGEGIPWLSFGSFWSGIKICRLDFATGKVSTEDETIYPLAQRFVNEGSVEAPFIVQRGEFYYLFVSFDFCCRGIDSSYHVMVGRSDAITGPYIDRDGVEMLSGGGSQVTFPTERWKGPGHCAIYQEAGIDYLVYHAYDAESQGTPTLRIAPLSWDEEGWPSI
jgi:arabinan endo-1,5-alpha-L-arabinosidase